MYFHYFSSRHLSSNSLSRAAMTTLLAVNSIKQRGDRDSTKCNNREVNALSDWTITAVGKGDGYVAHYGPHLCLCNFGNSGYQSVSTK